MRSGPRLYRGETDERHATWLELFFDLVFAAAVANLGEILVHAMSLHGLLVFAGLFVPVWWIWIDFSYYADQFESDDLVFKLGYIGVMFAVILLGRAVAAVPHGDATTFVFVYGALRVAMIALYLRAALHVAESRELALRYALSFSLALGIWGISLAASPPLRFWWWGAALAVEILNGPVTYATLRNVPRQVSHMDERFGLFVLIVLGEAVVSVARGLPAPATSPQALIVGFCGFVVAASIFLLQFGRVGATGTTITRALRGGPRELLRSFVYGYAHLFVFAGTTALGAAFLQSIRNAAGSPAPGARIVLAAAVALTLVGVTTVHASRSATLSQAIVPRRALALAIAIAATLAAPSVLSLSLVVAVAFALLVASERNDIHRIAADDGAEPLVEPLDVA